MKFQYTYELDNEVDRQLKVIGSSIIKLTEYYQLSQYQLAEYCGLSSHAFWRLYQNEAHALRLKTLLRILNYFNIDLIEIIIDVGNTLIKPVANYSRFDTETQYIEKQVRGVNILINHIVKRENITMYRIARDIGTRPEVTRKIELNKSGYAPSITTIIKILAYFDIDLSESIKHSIDAKMGKKKPRIKSRKICPEDEYAGKGY